MIPYDELVIALNSWRAKQGLPVSQLTAPGSGSTRAAPPMAPPARGMSPDPLAAGEDSLLDVEESSLIEEAHYESEGDDFATSFPAGSDGESTAIGAAPRASETTLDDVGSGGVRSGGRNEDW